MLAYLAAAFSLVLTINVLSTLILLSAEISLTMTVFMHKHV